MRPTTFFPLIKIGEFGSVVEALAMLAAAGRLRSNRSLDHCHRDVNRNVILDHIVIGDVGNNVCAAIRPVATGRVFAFYVPFALRGKDASVVRSLAMAWRDANALPSEPIELSVL